MTQQLPIGQIRMLELAGDGAAGDVFCTHGGRLTFHATRAGQAVDLSAWTEFAIHVFAPGKPSPYLQTFYGDDGDLDITELAGGIIGLPWDSSTWDASVRPQPAETRRPLLLRIEARPPGGVMQVLAGTHRITLRL